MYLVLSGLSPGLKANAEGPSLALAILTTWSHRSSSMNLGNRYILHQSRSIYT